MKSTDKGIFLQRTAFSESSLIVTFLTENSGIQKYVYRGGKKKAHNIFPLSISEITFYGRKESELLNLTSVEPVSVQTFQFDPVKGTIAFFMAETLRKCLPFGQQDKDFFDFVEECIHSLENRTNLGLFPLEFLVRCSDALGFMPLYEDAEASVLNLDSGVFQLTRSNSERTQSGPGVDLIRSIVIGEELSPHAGKTEREEALEIMLMYFSIHIPRFDKLESYEIVREVLRA